MSYPKIAIIGGGPAGLTLARLLQHNSIPCTVFEIDQDRHARTQGGTLDLHEGSAQLALKEAGLYEQFLAHARPEGEVLKIYDAAGKVLMDENEGEGVGTKRPDAMKNRPEIDRVLLRTLLLDSLVEGSVRWGMKLLKVEPREDDTYDLHFSNGDVETGFDVVVGADGAWSKVRPLVSDAKPFYSGISGLDVKLRDADSRHPDLGKRAGRGMCLTLGPNKGILAQRNGDGAVRVYAFMRAAESWDKESGIDFSDMDAAKQEVVERYFGDWDQGAKDMVLRSDEDTLVRSMYMLPIGLTWESRAGIALIGDAAHLMTPFAGVGVNVAMEDALHLARNIITSKSSWSTEHKSPLATALANYEAEMFIRAEDYAKQTWMYLGLFFHERGGIAMVEHFERIRAKEAQEAVAATAVGAAAAVGVAVAVAVEGQETTVSRTENETESQIESESQTATESESQTATETESETQSESQSNSEPETEPESEKLNDEKPETTQAVVSVAEISIAIPIPQTETEISKSISKSEVYVPHPLAPGSEEKVTAASLGHVFPFKVDINV